ncbi:mediator of RNA polymerase II transcription subunit 12-like [Dorcoceras hygrometricum]|uniref:Mediator of RNA polymerase II transcription subunit 12-like n=1 Tax=Dorcoceras hygrometricum TaxID=472368 RepID=A0A2Z7AVE6_9LAMI|nr:mediator of RNA polymerase II transcription subunit 12-like [Dorcoceras hygrometricum]
MQSGPARDTYTILLESSVLTQNLQYFIRSGLFSVCKCSTGGIPVCAHYEAQCLMFKSLVDTGLEGFLAATGSVYEDAVVDFFVNAKVDEMRIRFSASAVPFRASSKKREMKIEYRLLHDIVAKALCAKAGSFDMVTMTPAGETSKTSGDATSETEGGQSKATKTMGMRKRKPSVGKRKAKKPDTTSAPSMAITKKRRTKRTKTVQPSIGHRMEPQPRLVPRNQMDDEDLFTSEIPEGTLAQTIDIEDRVNNDPFIMAEPMVRSEENPGFGLVVASVEFAVELLGL